MEISACCHSRQASVNQFPCLWIPPPTNLQWSASFLGFALHFISGGQFANPQEQIHSSPCGTINKKHRLNRADVVPTSSDLHLSFYKGWSSPVLSSTMFVEKKGSVTAWLWFPEWGSSAVLLWTKPVISPKSSRMGGSPGTGKKMCPVFTRFLRERARGPILSSG